MPNVITQPEDLPPALQEAFLKLRQKTCVPSYIWQHMRKAPAHGNSQPLLMRNSSLKRLQPYLETLQQYGYIRAVTTTPYAKKKSFCMTTIEGVDPAFQTIATALFPTAMV
ncbi:hypothetical protein [Magnetococcus sp. PR-3]|uniref:hypothetical protein n=1 Tax=Magnetococcus sp. PR-3 TaxID=3120355 RepID=UPI002FCE5B70